MRLVKPTVENRNEIKEMIEEFMSNGEIKIFGSSKATKFTYKRWLNYLAKIESPDEKLLEKGYVPTIQYVLYDGEIPIGFFCARQHLTPKLIKASGHMGYSIRPTKRRMGYASAGVKLLLDEYKSKGVMRVLVCCFSSNVASAKTIVKCGGVMDGEVELTEGIVQRYWIENN